MKRSLVIGSLLLLVGAGCFQGTPAAPAPEAPAGKRAAARQFEDSIFVIDGKPVELNGGIAQEQATPDSSVHVTTMIFGQPVQADLDADGDTDAAMFLSHDPGGSGQFYYVAASILENGEYRGTDAVLLGDRIAPQTLEVRDGLIIANYATRKPGQPMTAQPSVGVSEYFRLEGGQLVKTTKP